MLLNLNGMTIKALIEKAVVGVRAMFTTSYLGVYPPAFSWERGHLVRHFCGRDARTPRGE